jgi:putative methionine-R-sulfoxide reductase with GAF domain
VDLLITLLEKVCVICLLGYVVSRAGFFRVYLEGRHPRWKDAIPFVGILGLFSIYGTIGGVPIGDAIINVRDTGPMIAGLVGGPVAGLLVGLIGGLHRLWLGWSAMETWTGYGYTCIPCSISTVLVGVLAGLIRRQFGLLGVGKASLFAFLGESLHMLLGLLLAGNPAEWFTNPSISQAWELVIRRAAVPMILANGLGVGIFFFALQNYLNELSTARQRDTFYEQVEQRNVELQMVYQIGKDIIASLDLDETLQIILDRVRQMVPFEGAEVCLYDQTDQVLRVRAWAGSDAIHVDTRGFEYRLGQGYTGWIAEHRQSLLVDDVDGHHEQQPVRRQLADELVVSSYVGVPLLTGSEMVGTIELISTQKCAFDEHSRQLLETIAPQAAIAVYHARQVIERERALKDQIATLRIELDEIKREKQVAEITESEFFRDLQQRVHKERNRKRK